MEAIREDVRHIKFVVQCLLESINTKLITPDLTRVSSGEINILSLREVLTLRSPHFLWQQQGQWDRD